MKKKEEKSKILLFFPSLALQNLTEEMVQRAKKAPKLKAKGAETRHLVPFGLEVESSPKKKTNKPKETY